MRPDPVQVLYGLAGVLTTEIAAEMATPFGLQTVNGAAGILAMIAQEYDRAAARLAAENEAVAHLLRRAADSLPAGELAGRALAEAGSPLNEDLHVSRLQAENDRLRRALVEVHAAIESLPGEQARAMDEAIWDELRQSTRRRHLVMG
ncbi:MAG: hypothetical protein ACR2HN_01455 [Tepidiformaceae bacterium]